MSRVIPLSAVLLIAATAIFAQTEPERASLEKAYEALRAKDYDVAVQAFQQAIAVAPDRASIRKDLAYTLLKIGETEAARDQFAEAIRIDPSDDHAALEYAFLCYETKQEAIARRVFDRIRKTGNATAEQAFENIDRPLREGIARWKRVVELEPDNFSAHEELAHLAERRDELDLAAENYEKAWRLRPGRRGLLLDLGRVWKAQNKSDEANAALLAASRGAEPRVAEEAKELLPQRYPYVYEFQKALDLDPSNVDLRRELAYLFLELGNRADAGKQFQIVVDGAPGDLGSTAQLGLLLLSQGDTSGAMPLLERVLAGNDEELASRVRASLQASGQAPAPGPAALRARPAEPQPQPSLEDTKLLAQKSLDKGFLKDALKYFQAAHESDPLDFDVMLKLGWTYNMLKDDKDAIGWFDLARQSPDRKTAAQAKKAYRNLKSAQELFRTTVWVFPIFSTRWSDLFTYAQAKVELRLPHWFIHPYLSVRFIGDSRGTVDVANLGPQYLSESSVILGLGLATNAWHGMTGWFEAGEALPYAPTIANPAQAIPDYRGGLSFAKGLGNLLTRGAHGLYAETNDDGIYVSRFSNDMLVYSQNRTGYTFRGTEGMGQLHAQLYWNWNVTVDQLSQYWANYVETGPGLRFRFDGLHVPLLFSVDALRGSYLVNAGNPRGPNYNDIRVGIWYAFTK